MKKLLIALVILVYFVPASLALTFYLLSTNQLSDSSTLGAFLIPIVFMLVVCALVTANIAGALISVMRSKCLSFRAVMAFKLCLIPFYIINFICWLIGSMVFHLSLIIWPLIPLVIVYTYFTMLGTSVHNISRLLDLRRNKVITTKQLVIHCILQLVFTLDVIDSVYLAIKQKKLESTYA